MRIDVEELAHPFFFVNLFIAFFRNFACCVPLIGSRSVLPMSCSTFSAFCFVNLEFRVGSYSRIGTT